MRAEGWKVNPPENREQQVVVGVELSGGNLRLVGVLALQPGDDLIERLVSVGSGWCSLLCTRQA